MAAAVAVPRTSGTQKLCPLGRSRNPRARLRQAAGALVVDAMSRRTGEPPQAAETAKPQPRRLRPVATPRSARGMIDAKCGGPPRRGNSQSHATPDASALDGRTPDQIVTGRLEAEPALVGAAPDGRAGSCDTTKARVVAERAKEASQPDSGSRGHDSGRPIAAGNWAERPMTASTTSAIP